MATNVRGGASPPIVFIAQLGTSGDSWQPVLRRLECGAATFTYDRPGTGDAPPRPAPNRAIPYSVFADELAALLDRYDVTTPVVLVGHSVGSLIARSFADRHRERVAGLVAVDGSIPQFRLWPTFDPVIDGDLPTSTEIDIVTGQVEILQARPVDVPAVVLVRRRRWWWPSLDAMPHPALGDLWQVSQQVLAAQWNAPLIRADEAGHQLPREVPGLVAYAVDAVVQAARTGVPVVPGTGRLAELGGSLIRNNTLA